MTLLVTLLFVAHPTHAEVVANIKSRDEILCFLFLMGMLWSLYRHAGAGRARHLGLSLALFALALLTKEHAITFLALVPLVLFTCTKTPFKAAAGTTGLFALVAVVYLLLRKAVVGVVLMPGNFGGLTNVLTLAQTPSEALGTRLMILWNYLRLLVFPLRLSWDYSYNIVPLKTLADPRAIAAGLVFLALLAGGLWGLRKRSVVAFGLLFFLITFSVVSNLFLPLRWTLAERFLFTPSLGICIALGVGVNAALERFLHAPRARRPVLLAIFSIVLLFFSVRTFTRNGDWRSEFDLYLRDAATHPEGARIHQALASAYRNRAAGNVGREERERLLRRALEEYRQSIAIFPAFPLPYEGLTYVLYSLGDFAAAERSGRRAVELAPVSAEATHLLAAVCYSLEKHEEAVALFKRTLLLSPFYPGVDLNLAAVYSEMGLPREAIHHLEEAARKNPGDPEPHLRLQRLRGGPRQARTPEQR